MCYYIIFILISQGVPIVYYGTEQAFSGSNDPNNRESLWPHYDTSTDLYKFISTLATFRMKRGPSVYNSPQVERYVDDQFFAFTRDKVRMGKGRGRFKGGGRNGGRGGRRGNWEVGGDR